MCYEEATAVLRIEQWDESNNYRTLKHSREVFHKALRAVLDGETRFHVTGAPKDYDLVYENNNDFVMVGGKNETRTMFVGETLMPPYYFYDENDTSCLRLDILSRYDNIIFEKANEYTIVLADLLLRLTDKAVFILDERAGWFLPEHDRLHLGIEPSDGRSEMRVCEDKVPIDLFSEHGVFISIFLFQEVFLLQWLCGGHPLEQIKYAEICVKKTEGIGALLQYGVKCAALFNELGIKTVFKAGTSRYSDEMLKKYFKIETTPEDSDETNTIYIVNYMAVVRTFTYIFSRARISYDILNPEFLREMDEYVEAVIQDRHMLGVLFRGTDYMIAFGNMPPHMPYAPVPMEEVLPVIRQRMKKYHYDGIFLATEDKEALKTLREAFPGKVFTVAQERRKMDDFAQGQTISDLEKDIYHKDEYDERVADTTINYFYALYALSKCDGFLASTLCNGVNIVRAFNEGRFECDDVVREMIIKGEMP